MRYIRGLELLAECLEVITKASSRINECILLFQPSPDQILHNTLVEYHSELITFLYEAVKFFQRGFFSEYFRSLPAIRSLPLRLPHR